jgi:hypothetical protein
MMMSYSSYELIHIIILTRDDGSTSGLSNEILLQRSHLPMLLDLVAFYLCIVYAYLLRSTQGVYFSLLLHPLLIIS